MISSERRRGDGEAPGDAQRDADHPVPAAFPEGLYLSTLIAEVSLDR